MTNERAGAVPESDRFGGGEGRAALPMYERAGNVAGAESVNRPSSSRSEEVAFLLDLSALTRKHGIAISGCGCCGSPFLSSPVPRDGHYEQGDGSGQVWWKSAPVTHKATP